MIKLKIAIYSHISDAMYEMELSREQQLTAKKRLMFVKALIKDNPDLEKEVTEEYLDNLFATIQ